MPKWVDHKTFAKFINYLETGEIENYDIEICKNLIWVSGFFKIDSLIHELINTIVRPLMTTHHILSYFEDCLTKINNNKSKQTWY